MKRLGRWFWRRVRGHLRDTLAILTVLLLAVGFWIGDDVRSILRSTWNSLGAVVGGRSAVKLSISMVMKLS